MARGPGIGGEAQTGASRIVVGVDGSPTSLRALSWAATEARLRKCTLEVVHANFYRRELLAQFGRFAGSEKVTLTMPSPLGFVVLIMLYAFYVMSPADGEWLEALRSTSS